MGTRLIHELIFLFIIATEVALANGNARAPEVDIFGNYSLDDATIRKMAGLDSDSFLAPEEVLTRLKTTGLFSNVHVKRTSTSLYVTVVEKTMWFAIPYLSAGEESLILGLAGGRAGILGGNAQILSRFQRGTDDEEGSIFLRNEFFLDSNFLLGATLDYEHAKHRIFSDREVSSRTDNRKRGGSILNGYRFNSSLFLGLNTYLEKHRFQNPNLEYGEGLQISHKVYLDYGKLSLDEGLTQGASTRLYFERVNPLGDFSFFKAGLSGQASPYLRGDLNWISRAKFEIGNQLPYYQHFEIGGASLRGFPSQQFRDDSYFTWQNDLLLLGVQAWGVKLRPLLYLDWAFVENSGRTGLGTGFQVFLRNVTIPAIQFFAGYGLNPTGFSVSAAVGRQSCNIDVIMKSPNSPNAILRAAVSACVVVFCNLGIACAAPQTMAQSAAKLPTDKEIVLALTHQLFSDPYFSPKDIHIDATNGVVSLKGDVDNLRAKDVAVAMAESLRGVQSVVDRLNVRPIAKTDPLIKDEVRAALSLDPSTLPLDIVTTVKDQTVSFKGIVDSQAQVRLAIWVAKGIEGVKDIEDRIDVQYKPRADNEILTDIEGRMRKDAWLDSETLKVKSSAGQVAITGSVESAAAKKHVETLGWVSGVKSVTVENLRVDPKKAEEAQKAEKQATAARKKRQPTDEQVRLAINDTLLMDPRFSSSSFQIKCKDRIVTLEGTVNTLLSKQVAEEDARHTQGVAAIFNHLQVTPPIARTDTELSRDIRRSLALSLPKEKSQILIEVSDGVVKITGKVNGPYEAWLAKDAASRIAGVLAVNDSLTVEAKILSMQGDSQIASRIHSAIISDPFLGLTDTLEVRVKSGVAYLSGTVNTWFERSEATRIAFQNGARNLYNEIAVREDPFASKRTEFYSKAPFDFYDYHWMS